MVANPLEVSKIKDLKPGTYDLKIEVQDAIQNTKLEKTFTLVIQ